MRFSLDGDGSPYNLSPGFVHSGRSVQRLAASRCKIAQCKRLAHNEGEAQ